jgi:mRNA interferase MazF
MALNKGDIVLVQFPFSDLSQTKLRPALVLAASKSINEITLCFISSQNIQSLSSDEFAIVKSDNDFAKTGLKTDSKVRVTRIITLEHKLIVRKLGKLSERQIELLDQTLKQAFNLN